MGQVVAITSYTIGKSTFYLKIYLKIVLLLCLLFFYKILKLYHLHTVLWYCIVHGIRRKIYLSEHGRCTSYKRVKNISIYYISYLLIRFLKSLVRQLTLLRYVAAIVYVNHYCDNNWKSVFLQLGSIN